ncbi:MAG: hypothetical protein IKB59_01530 [Alphaproteobacteria bacterium]|nr:hypothetical protein [Alphaproteobacteria bacterium]
MKQSEPDYTKETFSEKLRRHTMDIIMISMMACMFTYFITNHQSMKKSVPDIKHAKSVNIADTIKTKTR